MHLPVAGFSDAHFVLGESETRQKEIIKHHQRLHRFGEVGLRQHAHRGQIQQALQLLKPDQLVTVLKNASQALNAASTQADGVHTGERPQLASAWYRESKLDTPYAPDSERHTDAARLLSLLGKIAQLSSDASLQNLLNRLRGYNVMMAGANANYAALATQLEQQAQRWAEATDALKQAQTLADGAQQCVTQAQQRLEEWETHLQALLGQAEGERQQTGVVSAALQEKIDNARQTVALAQQQADTARTAYQRVVQNSLTPALNAETQTRTLLQETQLRANQLVAGLTGPQIAVIDTQHQTHNPESKSIAYLMAIIAQLISESTSEDMRASAALKEKLAQANAQEAERRGRDYETQVRKAEEMQKTMGCIGKALGWAITVVGVAAAVFTGGASLVLAGIGLALTVGDEIYHAATGRSYMQEAFQPLMEKVVKPLMELLGKGFTELLSLMGVDSASAERYGQILGAVAATMVLIAGALVAGKVMSKMASMMMEKIGATVVAQTLKAMTKNTLTKAMDNSVGQFLKGVYGGLGRAMNLKQTHLMSLPHYLHGAYSVAALAGTTVQTIGSISAADLQVEAEKARARMLNSMALQEILNEMMSRMLETFTRRQEGVNAILSSMAVQVENQRRAGQYIARRMGGARGG